LVNQRQIKHQYPGVLLAEHCVTQYRTGVASHNSAMASENTYVSQFLNGYLQHHHLLPTFPEIFPSGVAVGTIAALGVTRLIRSMLYETQTADPLAISTSAALLIGTAFIAALLPAHHASNADPMQVLREQ
jgi:hypothetical protein